MADLGVLARQSVRIEPGLEHHELFTTAGLLTVLWHGPPDAEAVLVACGGAMGGLLGPADGLYQDLGLRPGRRRHRHPAGGLPLPGELAMCSLDLAAALQLAERNGAVRAVTMGHSFGGAVAVRVGAALPDIVTGVVGLATQSAGCEVAARPGRPAAPPGPRRRRRAPPAGLQPRGAGAGRGRRGGRSCRAPGTSCGRRATCCGSASRSGFEGTEAWVPADDAAVPSLDELTADLAAEHADLDGLVADLDEAGLDTPTPAEGWQVRDQVSHLAWFDREAVRAALDPESFAATLTEALSDEAYTERAVAEGRAASPVRSCWRGGGPPGGAARRPGRASTRRPGCPGTGPP